MSTENSTQSHRLVRLNTILGEKALIASRFNGTETMSEGFNFTIQAFSESHHDLSAKDLVGTAVTVGLVKSDNTIRYFNGFVQEMSALGSERDGQRSNYTLQIVSWAQLFMKKRVDTRIFQEKNIEDIIKDVFVSYGANAKFKFNLKSAHLPRRFCVQYNETDWNFFNRLCRLEGVAYYFKHENGKHVLHIIDDQSGCETLNPQTVKIQSQNIKEDYLTNWQNTGRFITGKYSQRTYNYLRPTTLSPVEHTVASDVSLTKGIESYQYNEYSHDKTDATEDLKRKSRVNTQKATVSTATGNCRHLVIATHFDLALANGKDFTDKGKEFTFSKINISADDVSGILSCHIEAIPKGELAYPKAEYPKIEGLQTAVVTGPQGEEIHTDDLGRIKVQFHWDRLGKLDQKSTCFLRVMQSFAGSSFGAHFTPRIGQEVVVAFENGNPDRPFVLGGLYHQEHKPPYGEQKGTRAGIRTRSTKGGGITDANELYLEDTKGSEEFYIQAQKDLNGVIKNDETRSVGNDQTITINNDQSITVSNNQTTEVSKNSSHLIGDELLLEAGKKITLKVGGSTVELTSGKIIIKSGVVDIDGSTVQIN
ncbi:MAG: type VI secretion system Vgr family protein [Cellvibrionaceae bacterium]